MGEGIDFKIEPKNMTNIARRTLEKMWIFLFIAENGQNSLVLVDKMSNILSPGKKWRCSLGRILKLDYFQKDFDSEHFHIFPGRFAHCLLGVQNHALLEGKNIGRK